MQIKIRNEFIFINILVVLLVVIVTVLPLDILRYILGFITVIFFPGYALMAALFPRKATLDVIERVAYSIGMSIPVVGFIGFLHNYVSWGIRLESVLYSIALFIFVASFFAWTRRRRLAIEERFNIEFSFRIPGWGGDMGDRVLSAILVIAILGVLGMLGYAMSTPKIGERFTEFYLLGMDGKAEGYPKKLVAGQEAEVLVGIINREHETVSYRVEVKIDGLRDSEIGPRVLGHEQKWEEMVSFTPGKTGQNESIEFILYKEGTPYRSLHLWVDVIR